MTNRRALRAPLLAALFLLMGMAACSEDTQTGAVCPALCPGQEIQVRDTLLDPTLVLDTNVTPFPIQGQEPVLLLAARGDTLDVRGVVRFDTLTRRFRAPATDTLRNVTRLDSAFLTVRVTRSPLRIPASFSIDVYDVDDLTVPDSAPTSLLPHFVPARLLGTVVVDSTGLTDTTSIRIHLDTVRLLAIVTDSARRLRVGLQVRASQSVEVRVRTAAEGTFGPQLRYRVHTDTTVPRPTLFPSSSTPARPPFASGDLVDYSIVADAPEIRAGARFAVGGLPASRSYLRFDLPLWLTDSTSVIRARLELTQDPVYGMNATDSLTIHPHLVIAGTAITDLRRAADLLAPEGFLFRDSLRIAPADSGLRHLELMAVIANWRSVNGVRPFPTAIVLRSTREGATATGVRFFGTGAGAAVRPKLRVSYVPNLPFGQP